jgi:hypothetical protein
MTDQPLSPAAQAVLDAYINAPCGKSRSTWVAAALRAAADQVVPKDADPIWGTDIDWAKWRALDDVRDELLAIVAELDNTSRPS